MTIICRWSWCGQVVRILRRNLCPSNEFISFIGESICRSNVYCFIDLKILFFSYFLKLSRFIVICMPSDVCRFRRVFRSVNSPELYSISETRVFLSAARVLFNPRVGFQNIKFLTREHFGICIFILLFCFIPFLYYPVLEILIIILRLWCCTGDRFGTVYIKSGICRRWTTYTLTCFIINQSDTFCAFKCCTPLAIKLDLAYNIVTVNIFIVCSALAPFIHVIRIVVRICFVIFFCNSCTGNKCIRIKEGAIFEEPTHKVVITS